MEILRRVEWIPPPLSDASEIFGDITPTEITGILMNVWDFIRDYPPSPSSYSPIVGKQAGAETASGNNGESQREWARFARDFGVCHVEQYVVLLKNIMRNNVVKLSSHYPHFYQRLKESAAPPLSNLTQKIF